MAKLSSLFKFEGTVDDITVVKNTGTVRRKGGLSRDRIATDPALSRIRENNMEFGMLAAASKLTREAFTDIRKSIRVQFLQARLLSLYSFVKNLDATSSRGYRQVAMGISTVEGKQHLRGFNFNPSRSLGATLQKPYDLDTVTGKVTIPALAPAFDTLGGVGANMVGFKAYWAKIDFASGLFEVSQTKEVKLALNSTITDVVLEHIAPPTGTGIHVFVLSVMFYQSVNGIDYLLQNGAHNAADIIEVV